VDTIKKIVTFYNHAKSRNKADYEYTTRQPYPTTTTKEQDKSRIAKLEDTQLG